MKFIAPLAIALTTVTLFQNARADITSGLALYLPLDETTGLVAHDATANGNNGTLINFSGNDSYWSPAWITNGLSFSPPGTTTYISIPDAGSLNFTNEKAFTLAAWVKMVNPTVQVAGAALIAKGTGGGGEQYDLDLSAAGTGVRYRLVVRTAGGTATTASTAAAPANNVWQHIAAVFDGSNTVSKTIKLYINGQLNGTPVTNNANFASLRFSANPVTIAARQSASAGYNLGVTNTAMDEVRIYNRALSASDIFELYSFGGRLPSITTQPRSVTNFVGDLVPFNIGIDANNSTLPVGYQWKWYGTNLPGATAATLVLTNVQVANSGPYYVAVSNVIGVTNSALVYLQVQPLPAANITANLAGYWKLDEASGSGTAVDSSGNANDGALTGFTDLSTCWGPGLTNGALSFNGDATTGNLVAVPGVGVPAPASLDFYSSQAFTLAAWVKASLPQTNGAAILCKGTGNGGEQFAMDINGGLFRLYARNTNAVAFNLNTTVAPNGTWQHVAAVLDATNGIMNYYVNGQLAGATVAPTSLNTNTHELSIGNRQSGAATAYNLPLTGALDDVRLYSRALTSSDVQALYAAGGLYPPSFSVQPVGASLYAGDNFRLSATVSGTVPISLQWKTNGVNVPGATNATLNLPNIQVANAATYTLFASNTYGTILSSPAVVQVAPFSPTDALAGWWKFDDATGPTAIDSTANANHASLNSFPSDDTEWVPGRINTALSFSLPGYTNSFALIPDAASLNFDSSLKFTLSAWVKGPAQQISGAGIVTKGIGAGGETYNIDVNGGFYRFFVRTAGNTAVVAINSTVAPNGLWQHLVASFDGAFGTMNLYVNGQLVGTNAAPNSLLSSAHEVSIGAREASASSGYSLGFFGLIDDVRIYNRALSATDALNLYFNAGLQAPIFLTQPVGSSRYVGDNILFSALADGTQPLSYQWRKNGVNITGATNTSLVLTNLQTSDTANYSVQVTNIGGVTNSDIAALTVNVFSIANTVGYWTFNEISGSSAADSSGNSNAGVLNNFPGDSSWIPGRIAGSLSFNGDGTGDDVVTVADAPSLNFNTNLTFSVAAWVRGSPSQANGAGIIAKGAGAGGEQYALDTHLDLLATPGYRFYVRNAAGVAFNVSTVVAPNNRWQHLVAVFDGSLGVMQVYVDGQLSSSGAGPSTLLNSSHEVSIGNRQSGAATGYNLPFAGVIDDVRMYTRALKASEVQQLYAVAGPFAPVFYTQPLSLTRYAHDSATFSVLADGTDPLSYQWKKNGGAIAGATQSSFTLANLQFSDAATYTVQVSNGSGVTNSSGAILTVQALPAPDLATELIVYFPFDETTGLTATDASGRANDASLYGTFPGDDSQWVPGRIGGALRMNNGVADNLVGTVNPVGLDNPDLFSFSFWAKRDPGSAIGNPRFISPNGSQSWVQWTPGRGVGMATPAVSTEPSSNTWHHFVTTYDRSAGTYSQYVDGVRQVSDASGFARTDPGSQYWYFGHSENASSSSDSWTGLLDDVRIYNRLLNLNDVQALYFTAGQPGLTVARNGSSITLSWPVGATGFNLYGASALTGATWTQVGTTPVVSADGATQSVTLTPTASMQFYRLQKP